LTEPHFAPQVPIFFSSATPPQKKAMVAGVVNFFFSATPPQKKMMIIVVVAFFFSATPPQKKMMTHCHHLFVLKHRKESDGSNCHCLLLRYNTTIE
jgi:hypothetical protein